MKLNQLNQLYIGGLICLYCAQAFAQNNPINQNSQNNQVITTKEILPNGLKVIVQEDHRAPVVMSQLWYKIGSVDEQVGKSGLSHALEHMMFKGTPNVPEGEFMKQVKALGGTLNAYTTATETVYHENVAKEHLPKILEMEADRMVNLNFSDKTFLNEIKVIREERRQNTEDTPRGQMYEALISEAFTKPSNRTAVIGAMKDLYTLKANDLRDWYKKWYAPNNATLIIVGDVDSKQTIDLVKEKFGKIPMKLLPKRQDISESEFHQSNQQSNPNQTKIKMIEGNTKQPLFFMAFRVPKLELNQSNNKIPYALDMLTNILDGHSSARFDKNLIRGKELALESNASYSIIDRSPQLWRIGAMPSAKTSAETLQQEIMKEIQDIAENGISEEELNIAKIREETNMIYVRDSLSSQANLLALLETNGFDFKDENTIRQHLRELTPQDIQAAAKLLLDKKRQIIIQLNPKSKPNNPAKK